MSLFCLALPLVFFLFWKSLSEEHAISTGGIWALVLGSILAIIHYMASPLITSGEFGFLQWMIGFIDVIAFPVLIALGLCLLFMFFKLFSATIKITNFLLLWCIPFGVIQMMSHSTQAEPLYLVIVPLMWIALAVGFGFFIKSIPIVKQWVAILCIVGAVFLPFVATTSYWALYCQNYILGYVLFGITLLPMIIHTGMLFIKTGKNN
ncbi:MAG: hypothetical protein LBV20_06655 [Treponema sp.]|jgi:hypothetical protein|nr:hypothetical protein [Treponema sp.]